MVNNDDTVLKKVITGDQSWVNSYDPETKKTIFTVEACRRATAEKSKSKLEQCEINVDCFFSIMKVLCTMNMHRQVRQSIKNITFKF